MNRNQRRQLNKSIGKQATLNLELMLNMPDHCLTCDKPYDKLSKEMATTWSVNIYADQKRVDLFCPECFKKRGQNEGST